MKIAHICLSCFYIDNYSYQENKLVSQHVKDGHDVVVIASTEVFDEYGNISYTQASEYVGSDDATVHRLPYMNIFNHKISSKLRLYKGTINILERFQPDVILFHGACALELLRVTRYKEKHPNLQLFVDCHEDFNNSAKSFFSKWVLHWLIYRYALLKSLRHISKILCVTPESIDFMNLFYGVPKNQTELFPLGGNIYSDDDYDIKRVLTRKEYGISNEKIVFLQSGKIDQNKKLIESLESFKKTDNINFTFLVVGILMDDIKNEAVRLIKSDKRIQFLGWKDAKSLDGLLCSADFYLQPGSQSATLQHSLCNRCGIIVDNIKSHEIFKNNNGFYISNHDELDKIFLEISKLSRPEINRLMDNSLVVARNILDYKKLAQRILV